MRSGAVAAILDLLQISEAKLPELAPAGTPVGTLAPALARELGLSSKVRLIVGGHSPCCTALGAGVVRPELALYELGSALRMAVTFEAPPLTSMMLPRGLSLGYHVAPELYLSLVYTASGGALLKWYRDQVAADVREAQRRGASAYGDLLAEMPEEPTNLMALPHWAPPGPPLQIAGIGGCAGLVWRPTRGEVLKALLRA